MTGRVYLLDAKQRLTPMDETPYDSEALLQDRLATHPDLLAGDQIDPDVPRRWLLVMREMRVPGGADESGRWSLDHLFLDQDAIPTLVEVKRSSDTRIRRSVVGQMLDYAANAIRHWPDTLIRAKFVERCEHEGRDADAVLAEFLGDDEPEPFWARLKRNLETRRIRLLFVADEIPGELRSIVEFLNAEMENAEVLAIEIKQYQGQGATTLVPRLVGQTESARQRKSVGSSGRSPIVKEAFLAVVAAERSPAEYAVVEKIVDWTETHGFEPSFTTGVKSMSFTPVLRHASRPYYPISVQARGVVVVQFRWLKDRPPFDDDAKRRALWDRFTAVPGFTPTEVGFDGFPRIPLSALTNAQSFAAFTSALTWFADAVEKLST